LAIVAKENKKRQGDRNRQRLVQSQRLGGGVKGQSSVYEGRTLINFIKIFMRALSF
jgi:hypothetical protein